MCPIDVSGTLRDANPGHNGYNFEVRRLLTRRFGATIAEDLVKTYEDAWITAGDLDNIQALGLNVVRLTLAYDTMLNDDGQWRANALTRMDWLVKNAWDRGLYTIVDFHASSARRQPGRRGGWILEQRSPEGRDRKDLETHRRTLSRQSGGRHVRFAQRTQ